MRIPMRHWRIALLILLFAAPALFFAAVGIYFVTERGWWLWVGWAMLACVALAYFLAWRWQRGKRLLTHDVDVPLHWTERDREAWKLVEARAQAAEKLSLDKLSTIDFYWETARDMALELARVYHPKAQDPVGKLTLPEILSVIELAAHDLKEMVDTYLPGGHLLTVNDWRRAKQMTEWYQTASNIGWVIAGLFNPINTGLRFLAA